MRRRRGVVCPVALFYGRGQVGARANLLPCRLVRVRLAFSAVEKHENLRTRTTAWLVSRVRCLLYSLAPHRRQASAVAPGTAQPVACIRLATNLRIGLRLATMVIGGFGLPLLLLSLRRRCCRRRVFPRLEPFPRRLLHRFPSRASFNKFHGNERLALSALRPASFLSLAFRRLITCLVAAAC